VRQPRLFFLDDEKGKPVAIEKFIGRRPVAAFGNSDGDLQMLQWTTVGRAPSLGMLVHHDDAGREYAYDRDTHVGKLAQALDSAGPEGWVVISMKKDWKRVFPDEGTAPRQGDGR